LRRGCHAAGLGLATLALAACGPAGVSSESPVTLALAFQSSATYDYKVHVSATITVQTPNANGPVTSDIAGTARLQVLSTDAEGVTTVKISLTGLTTTVNGQSLYLTGKIPSSFTARIGKDGQLLGFGAETATTSSSASASGLDQLTPLLPDHPVRPGDTWTKDTNQPNPLGGGGSTTVHSTNKFVRYETVNGVRAAVINSKGSGHLDITVSFSDLLQALGSPAGGFLSGVTAHITGDLSFDGTLWLDYSRKELLKTDGAADFNATYTLTGLPGAPGGAAGSAIPISGKSTFSFQRV